MVGEGPCIGRVLHSQETKDANSVQANDLNPTYPLQETLWIRGDEPRDPQNADGGGNLDCFVERNASKVRIIRPIGENPPQLRTRRRTEIDTKK